MAINLSNEAKREIKKNLVAFRDVVLVNDAQYECEPAPFHFELSDLLLHEKEHVAIEMFRESGKSSFALRAFPLHCLAFPDKGRDFIVIIKQKRPPISVDVYTLQITAQIINIVILKFRITTPIVYRTPYTI